MLVWLGVGWFGCVDGVCDCWFCGCFGCVYCYFGSVCMDCDF